MGKLKEVSKWIVSDAINGLLFYLPGKLKKQSTSFKALFSLMVVSIVWGTTWVVSKQGVMQMPALQMAGLRQMLGGGCYLAYYISKKNPWPGKQEFLPLFILAILNFVLSNGLSTWGVKYIPAGLGAIMGAIFPLWIVLAGFMAGKSSPPLLSVIGIITGFAGICFIFYRHLPDFLVPEFRLGIILSLAATWSWAAGTIYTKRHARVFNPYFGLGFQMLLGGIILSVISVATDPGHLSISAIPAISWFAIFYLVIFGSLIGFACYVYALQHLPTTQTAIYAYVNPIVALITGAIVLGEELSFTILTGCIITLAGIYMVNKSYSQKE